MIGEDYVSFETAKLLKEKGFDELCNKKYNGYKSIVPAGRMIELWQNSEFDVDEECSAPTLQMAMKWLREVHKCYITFTWVFKEHDKNYKPIYKDTVWFFNITIVKYNSARKGDGDYFDLDSDKEYNSYEQACEGAIKYCLENLI